MPENNTDSNNNKKKQGFFDEIKEDHNFVGLLAFVLFCALLACVILTTAIIYSRANGKEANGTVVECSRVGGIYYEVYCNSSDNTMELTVDHDNDDSNLTTEMINHDGSQRVYDGQDALIGVFDISINDQGVTLFDKHQNVRYRYDYETESLNIIR